MTVSMAVRAIQPMFDFARLLSCIGGQGSGVPIVHVDRHAWRVEGEKTCTLIMHQSESPRQSTAVTDYCSPVAGITSAALINTARRWQNHADTTLSSTETYTPTMGGRGGPPPPLPPLPDGSRGVKS